MTTTGYSDTFNRTVSNGFGTATSGQAYTISGTATQFSVAPNTAQIAISAAGNPMGLIDLQTQNVDITGQVALSAIPASNLATVGFAVKANTAANCYVGQMMVATGGAISIRFSKIVAGSLVTLATVSTGLTYVANTVYNLRFQAYWSRILQVNVLNAMLWVVGSNPPGGWMATSSTDAAFTEYTSGTQVGPYARDESTVLGTITAKFQNVAVRSYNLPMPAAADPMCNDPAVIYPDQTALQSLAFATDAAMASIDPLTSLATLYPRVRISNSNLVLNTAQFTRLVYSATEFNIGTPTNLGYDNGSLYLPVGVWLITFEIQLLEAASNSIQIGFFGGPLVGQLPVYMRSNAAQLNDDGVGGTAHITALTYATDPESGRGDVLRDE
jgi:hypothetical protein